MQTESRIARPAALLLASAAVVAAGCQAASSAGIATQDVYAEIGASADGTGSTRVTTDLRVGGAASNTFLALSSGDTLVAYAGSGYTMSSTMAESNILGFVSYASSFPLQAVDTPFKVSFERTVQISAPDSAMTLPAPFTLSGPAGSSSFSRQTSAIQLTWSPFGSADQMRWLVSGSCVLASGSISGDSGTYTIPAGTLVSSTNAGTCSASLTLSRVRPGQLDPAYGAGGTIAAQQTRSVGITSTP